VAYKKGERKHPTMRAIAASLTEQDMADLSAYYEKHGALVMSSRARPARAVARGRCAAEARAACASCHGANFSKPIDGSYPKLAGQHADYLYVALKAYQTEGNPNIGRSNAIMAGQVKQFKRTAELKHLAKYLARCRANCDGAAVQVPLSARSRLESRCLQRLFSWLMVLKHGCRRADNVAWSTTVPDMAAPPRSSRRSRSASCAWACTCMPEGAWLDHPFWRTRFVMTIRHDPQAARQRRARVLDRR
jgi:cytochrome c553